MRATWLLLVLGGCYRPGSAPCIGVECPPLDGPPIDTPPDSFADCTGTVMGTSIVRVCVPQVSSPLTLSSFSTDVDCDDVVTIDGYEVCVRWAPNITVNEAVKIEGMRPIVLVSTGSISLASNASIDVSSNAARTRIGAGAVIDDCTASKGISGPGGGGGAGGSFRTIGGRGGDGATGLTGGIAEPGPALSFRPGCHGGLGGADLVLDNGGVPGGAIYFIAGGTISLVNARINASGGGGDRAALGGGGAGGGSGGFIGFDAVSLSVDTTSNVFALGGGGSPGADLTNGGEVGDDPAGPTSPAMQIAPQSGCPGLGGGGSARLGAGAAGGNSNAEPDCGGGGGGGGSGYIGVAGGAVIPSGTNVAPIAIALP